MNEQRLPVALFRKDPAAYKFLAEHFQPVLTAFMTRHFKDQELAADLAAHAMMKLLEQKGRFEHYSQVKAFLYRVAFNAGINQHRTYKRRIAAREILAYLEDHSELPEPLKAEEALEREAIYQEAVAILKAKMDRLRPRDQQVIHLSLVQQMSTRQIAEKLEISPQTVRNIKSRILKKLRGR